MESIKISIGGDDYSFNSENKDIVIQSAEILNANIEKLQELYGRNADYKRILVLAALNSISEMKEEIDDKDMEIFKLTHEVKESERILSEVLPSDAAN